MLLGLGNRVCTGLDGGLSYIGIVQALVGTDAKPSSAEADQFARKWVENLCPQHKVKLP